MRVKESIFSNSVAAALWAKVGALTTPDKVTGWVVPHSLVDHAVPGWNTTFRLRVCKRPGFQRLASGGLIVEARLRPAPEWKHASGLGFVARRRLAPGSDFNALSRAVGRVFSELRHQRTLGDARERLHNEIEATLTPRQRGSRLGHLRRKHGEATPTEVYDAMTLGDIVWWREQLGLPKDELLSD